jgi:NAD(P)-dependent dehydrogenase (short-subunit alcohol dehydrogenase family)
VPSDLGTVIVTGGASGLGAAVAAAVAGAGGTPVVLDRREPENGVLREVVDLASPADARAAVARVIEEHGDVRGVVTAAGVDTPAPLADTAWEDWERTVAVNLLGTAAVVHAALPSLRANGGRIVTVASTLGLRVFGDATAYCASKFGVVGFTRSLATELAGEVGVTMLVPAGMRTRFFDDREERYKPGPDAQLVDPAEMAEAVLFALTRPAGVELRELVMTPSVEPSWP